MSILNKWSQIFEEEDDKINENLNNNSEEVVTLFDLPRTIQNCTEKIKTLNRIPICWTWKALRRSEHRLIFQEGLHLHYFRYGGRWSAIFYPFWPPYWSPKRVVSNPMHRIDPLGYPGDWRKSSGRLFSSGKSSGHFPNPGELMVQGPLKYPLSAISRHHEK